MVLLKDHKTTNSYLFSFFVEWDDFVLFEFYPRSASEQTDQTGRRLFVPSDRTAQRSRVCERLRCGRKKKKNAFSSFFFQVCSNRKYVQV